MYWKLCAFKKDRLPSKAGFISILKLITRQGSMKNARILQSILMLCSSIPNWIFWKHGQFLYVKWKAVIWEERGLELYVIKYILLIIWQFDSAKSCRLQSRCSTSVSVVGYWITNHVIYLKLRQKWLLLKKSPFSVKTVVILWIC